MLLMRGIEERAMTLYRQGKVPGSFYDGYGQEAVSTGAAFAMAAEDRLCILHRDLAAHIIRGVTPARIFAQYMGRAGGVTGGREGNVHFGDHRLGCVGMVSMLPDMMIVAAGMAMAFKLRSERRCAITWFGDGSTSRGDFHEAMNWAGVQRLPVIFVLENNQYAVSTPIRDSARVEHLSSRAAGYGIPGFTVDGNDAAVVYGAMQEPIRRARAGEGPTLVECMTFRHGGHHVNDPGLYLPAEQLERWKARDPLIVLRERLARAGVDTATVDAIDERVEHVMEEAVEFATESPSPSVETFLAEVAANQP